MLSDLIRSQLEQGFRVARTSEGLRHSLLHANRMVSVKIPHPTNPEEIISGYRVQHNNLLGPYKGGIRMTNSVCPDELVSLASWMTMKCSLFGLPLGGGKGGIRIDPAIIDNKVDLESIIKYYTRGIAPLIGEKIDVPAPDINTTSEMMDWMFQEYNNNEHGSEMWKWEHCVTGKNLDCYGLAGRNEATGVGVYQVLESYLSLRGEDVLGKTFCIQGLGNVGFHLAKRLIGEGAIMVGGGDLRGYYIDSGGIELDSLDLLTMGAQRQEGLQKVTKSYFLQTTCDIMILAASHLQVNRDTAQNLNCQIVLEAANGPLDMDADKVCREKGIIVIPDILANGGGVQASYYEMLQPIGEVNVWDDKDQETITLARLNDKMDRVTTQVVQERNKLRIDSNFMGIGGNASLRDASYSIALDNLQQAWNEKV